VSWSRFLVGWLLLAGCSSRGVIEGGGPSAGSQTGDEGSTDPCKSVGKTEIDTDTARDLGFAVDEHLALFDREFEVPFHQGDLDCTTLPPRVDGQIRIRATLQRLEHESFEPVDASTCLRWKHGWLIYHAAIQLEADNGVLAGNVEGPAYAVHPESGAPVYPGLIFSDASPPAAFTGSFGIRVDLGRPHEAQVSWRVAIGAPDFSSRVLGDVDYTDRKEPTQDQGDGMFWPSDFLVGQLLCGWLDLDRPQPGLVSLDQYNAR
jgi:hypothetical protein